ncbi:MAG: pilus assembly protein PilM [Planctomycetota bacterium]
MPFGLSRSRAPIIGVDFGAERLKLIQVSPGDPPQLIATAGVDLPDEVRDSAATRMAFFAEMLPKLVRSQPFKGRRVILSMPAIHTVVQQLCVEVSPDQSLDEQIEAELMQRLSLNPSRMLIRHHEVPVTGKGNEREFVCLAAPRDIVMQYIELARRSKLDVVGMYAEPLAILQAFDFMHRREGDDQRAVGYIDIGSATTKVVISHGTKMVFAKALPLGGEHFSREHARDRDVSVADARRARVAAMNGQGGEASDGGGVAVAATAERDEPRIKPMRRSRLSMLDDDDDAWGDQQPATVSDDGPTPIKPSAASEPSSGSDTLDCLVDEVSLCVRHHHNTFPTVPLERLVFLGGEAAHTPTCQAIARAVRTAAQLGDPLARLNRKAKQRPGSGVDLRRPQPGWAVPLGLSLSEPNL